MGNDEDQLDEAFIRFENSTRLGTDYVSFAAGWYAALQAPTQCSTATKARNTITLIDYLRERHPTVNALTAAEAKLLGIGYPLRAGWLDRCKGMPISDDLLASLRTAKARRYENESYRKEKAKSARRRAA